MPGDICASLFESFIEFCKQDFDPSYTINGKRARLKQLGRSKYMTLF